MNPPKSPIPRCILVACVALFPLMSHAQAPYAVWTKAYNGTGNFRDYAAKVAVDADGNAIVTGNSDGLVKSEITTVKYSAADGAVLWERRRPAPSGIEEYSQFIATDSAGNVIVVGAGRSDYQNYSYTAKYRAQDGALIWERFDTVFWDYYAHSVLAVDAGGNVVLSGVGQIVKYAAADGASIWDRQYEIFGVNGGSLNSVAVDTAGNVIVSGFVMTGGLANNADYYTAKYSATDGALIWERRYNGSGNGEDKAYALAVDASGNAIVTGISGIGFYLSQSTIKYAAADGALLWEKRVGNDSISLRPITIAVDASGNVVVASDLDAVGPGNSSHTAKYDSTTGSLIWENSYSAPRGFNYTTSLAVDVGGNVFTAGTSEGSGAYDDFFIVKYRALDGLMLAEFREEANSNENYFPVIALDSSGQVFITGTTVRPNNLGDDYLTLKVAMLETPDVAVQPPAPVVLQPSIVVQQPPGSTLVDGSATRFFGRVKVGRSGAARNFTITNTGTSVLSGVGVSLAGAHAKDFVLTKPRKTTLAPGASISFKILFKPKTKGSRNATLKITSDDPNGNPNGIQLSGAGIR